MAVKKGSVWRKPDKQSMITTLTKVIADNPSSIAMLTGCGLIVAGRTQGWLLVLVAAFLNFIWNYY